MKKIICFFFTASFVFSFFIFNCAAQQSAKLFPKGGVPGACGPHQNQKSSTPSPLDGNGSLGQSFNQSACGLNYVAATQRVETRYDPYTQAGNYGCGLPCSWSISGLPPCITVVKALVWANVSYQSGPPVGTISITNPLSSTNSYSSGPIGTSGPKCWAEAGTAGYRWDVTSSIANNGSYTFNFSGFGNPLWEIDGATIFIIYRDLSATYDGSLIFWDGAITDGQSGGSVNQTLTGFSVCGTPLLSTAFSITSDHQDNIAASHTSIMNGGSYSFPNSFSNFEVANVSLFSGQSSSVFGQSGGGSDCWLWTMAGLYYQSNCTSCTPSGLSATQSSTAATCGQSNGTATVNITGGIGPYTYLWNPPVAGNTNTAGGLPAGTYQVTITDAVGCNSVITIVVNGSPAPVVSATSTQTGCTVVNGSATATPSGGTAPYTYLWSNGNPNQTASNLAAGTYTVTVTDATGCTGFTTVTVTTMNGPATTSSVNSNISCNGGSNGSATTNPTGGTPGYTYSWSPTGGNAQTANNLPAGNYVVTVTDANGCSVTDNITISEPTAIALTTNQTNVLCSGGTNGNATAIASGGTPGYNYSWNTNPVQNTQTATGLSAGTYIVTVTDAAGCSNTQTVAITQPLPLTSSTSQTNVTCNGGNNGSATATVTNGTAPYSYLWNTTPVQNTQTANGLSSGVYIVTITDANGCTTLSSVTISQPPPVSLNLINCDDSVCSGDSTILSVSAGGGTSPYTFVWMPNSQNGDSISVNPSANTTYTVSVVDANGCTSLAQTCNVIVLPSATALFDTASSGTFGSTWLFSDLSSGGTSWFWNFGDGSSGSTLQNPVHTFSGAGTYTVTQIVFNQYGCPDTFKIIIDYNEGILVPNVFTPDGDGVNDVWYIPNSGMKEFHVEIFDRWGLKAFETTADEIRWDGRSMGGKLLSDGTYYFVLRAILKSGADAKNYSANGYVTLLTGTRKK